MRKLLLAIDQGTSGCKITVFDLDGRVIADKTKTYAMRYPDEYSAEQDSSEWWQAVVDGIAELLSESGIDPDEILGIGVDGTSWACIPIDRDGEALFPVMTWLDRRAVAEAEWMKETVGEKKLIETSGNPVDASYITPKILWLKKHHPEIYGRTYKFLQSNAFIVYRLTGAVSQDYSQGYGFHFFDMKKRRYDPEIADALGISLDLAAPLQECHEVVGGLTEAAAALTGLKAGTPVVAGGLDAACCTLGAGVILPGHAQEQGGQAGGMSIVMAEAAIHPKLILSCHVVPGSWLLQGGTTGGGGTLNWFGREFGQEEKRIGDAEGTSSFEVMSREAAAVPPGSGGVVFLPYMKGERSPLWNPDAKGVFYGLGYDKSRGHVIRSMMEGVAYSLRHNLETAEEIGAMVSELHSVGGSANSHVWTQLKADATGKRILVPYSDHATSLGAAILAGVGVGAYTGFEEAVRKTVAVRRIHQPDSQARLAYDQGFSTYKRLSRLLDEHMWRS